MSKSKSKILIEQNIEIFIFFKVNSSKENYSNDKNIDISIIEEEVETSEQQNDACFVALHIGFCF
jgi:hypothetical protein